MTLVRTIGSFLGALELRIFSSSFVSFDCRHYKLHRAFLSLTIQPATMNKFLRLVVALVGLFSAASAFTTVAPRTNAFSSSVVFTPAPQTTTTALNIVDPAIAQMSAMSNPVGSIVFLTMMVSIWELITPGRGGKK